MAKDKNKKTEKSSEKGIYRSKKTGKYVSKDYSKKHPETTIRESAPKKTIGSSKRGGSRSGGPKKA
ncbi:hypothetical protein ABDK00_018165 [Niabella insulamsoli]|uniref:hypothetical protein n=1 Tax=Niabella insulamsoli TaxID=3144874 RepID=UPI0031FBF1F2